MSNKLIFHLELLPHPYPNSFGAPFEAWGKAQLEQATDDDHITLLDLEWNLDSLAEWFADNYRTLATMRLHIDGFNSLPGESLAQALLRFRKRDFEETSDEIADKWFDEIYSFYCSHSLRFAFPGAIIPDIIIGLNHDDGEVSQKSENATWAYDFDLDDFLTTTRQSLLQFLSAWAGANQNMSTQERAKALMRKFDV